MVSSSRGLSRVRPGVPGPRGRLRSAETARGQTRWCGPAVLALATGRSYAGACALLRSLAPQRYPAGQEIVTTYWRDLVAVLDRAGIAHAAVPLPEAAPSLLRMVRWHGLAPGVYLVRVTDHFLLLRSGGFGLAWLHDNHHDGALLTGRVHGRRRVTHLVRLHDAPKLGEARAA